MSFGMASFSEEPMADSSASLRPWIIPALLLSIAFHGGLFYAASQKTLARFATSDQPRLVPRAFNVRRVQVDQKLLQPEPKRAEKPGKPGIEPASPQSLAQLDDKSFEKDMKDMKDVVATPDVSSP